MPNWTVPKIKVLLLGSVLPPEHPGWDDPELASKTITQDGYEKSVRALGLNMNGINTEASYN